MGAGFFFPISGNSLYRGSSVFIWVDFFSLNWKKKITECFKIMSLSHIDFQSQQSKTKNQLFETCYITMTTATTNIQDSKTYYIYLQHFSRSF